MTLARFKWEILDWFGYVFCEAAFRWWDVFDDTPLHLYPTRRDTLVWLIGWPSYKIGCFFYSLQNDEAAGVTWSEVAEEEDENR
jgi:hypothetical protein